MAAPQLSGEATAFISASQAQLARRQRLRRALLVAMVLGAVLVAVIAVVVARDLAQGEQEALAARNESQALMRYMLYDLHQEMADRGQLELLSQLVGVLDKTEERAGPFRSRNLRLMGEVRSQQGQLAQARGLFLRSISAATFAPGPKERRAAQQERDAAYLELIRLERSEGELERAELLLAEVQKGGGVDDLRWRLAMELGDLALAQGERSQAAAAYRRGLERFEDGAPFDKAKLKLKLGAALRGPGEDEGGGAAAARSPRRARGLGGQRSSQAALGRGPELGRDPLGWGRT